ncbi:MAG: hypothetical protein ABIJ56_17900 [Pseudomonadota bacterium]
MLKNIRYAAILLIILISALFVWAVLSYTHGHLSMPLDDSFIYFQLAKNITEGNIMEWSAGDGFTSAATSPLYPFVLAAGYGIGFKGDWIMAWALMIGASCLIASFFLLLGLSRRLLPAGSSEWWAWLAPFLFLLSGAQFWGYLSGMELALFATSLLAALVYALDYLDAKEDAGKKIQWKLAFWGGLTSVLRPEGLFVVLILAGVIIGRSALGKGRGAAVRQLPWLLLAAPAVIWMLTIFLLSGHFLSNAVYQKSYFHDPSLTPYTIFNYTFSNVKKILDNVYMVNHSPPFLILFFFIAAAGALLGEIRDRLPGRWTLIILVLVLGSFSTMMTLNSGWHQFRYQMPFFNLYLLAAGIGIATAWKGLSEKHRPWVSAVAAFFIVVLLVNLPRWVEAYGMNSKNIYEQQVAFGKFIERNIKKDAVIGLNDAGAIPYYSGKRCYDILGLATEDQSRWYRSGPGSLFEKFENLPADRLPGYFAVYPLWWFNQDILGRKVFEVKLKDNTICGDALKVLYEAQWAALRSGHGPGLDHGGLEIADRVDVADLLSEAAHRYEGSRTTVYASFAYGDGKGGGGKGLVADGGREIQCPGNGEKMTVSVDPGKSAVIAARLENKHLPLRLVVRINNRIAGMWEIQAAMGWQEPRLEAPAEFFTASSATVNVECDSEGLYSSYHYWVLQ